MSSLSPLAVALAAGGLLPAATFGIGINNGAPMPFAPVPSNADTFVGRVQDERLGTSPYETHLGTGSLIRPGVVLTAAHVVNEGVNQQRFERFELGGVGRAGLGVRHPAHQQSGALGMNEINDIGLILIPNMQPGGPLGTLGGALDSPGAGGVADIVGFTGVAAGNNTPLRGRATVYNNPSGVTVSEWIIDRDQSGSHLQGGDSGGPMIMTLPGNQRVIIGIIAGGRTADTGGFGQWPPPVDYCTRVSNQSDFIAGDGAVNAGLGPGRWNTFNRYGGGSQRWLANNAAWTRGTNMMLPGNGAFFPSNLDVAILDPTANPDQAIVVDVDGASNDVITVGGLLNDVTLDVHGIGAFLRVARTVGALNSGRIVARDGGFVQVDSSMDNQGEINLYSNVLGTLGTLWAGAAAPNMGAMALNNEGTINVLGGGQLVVTNNNGPALPSGAIALNRGRINVLGADSLALTDGMINKGVIEVQQAGRYRAPKFFENHAGAQLLVRAGAAPCELANADNSGVILVEHANLLTIRQLGRPDNAPAFLNRASGVLKLETNPAPTFATVEGTTRNHGLIELLSNGAGPTLTFRPGAVANADKSVINTGTITFNVQMGPGGRVRFENMSLYDQGVVNGADGRLEFIGASNFITQGGRSSHPEHDTRALTVVFDAAIGPQNAAVRFEAAAFDDGIGPAGMFGFNDPYSFHNLCIINGSSVVLEDLFTTQHSRPEAIYVRNFGIDAASTLDLNGVNLYYENLDIDCGGLAGTFLNGMPIQIPAPASSLFLIGASGWLATRRRRA